MEWILPLSDCLTKIRLDKKLVCQKTHINAKFKQILELLYMD